MVGRIGGPALPDGSYVAGTPGYGIYIRGRDHVAGDPGSGGDDQRQGDGFR
jgi:hypothetical protein